MIISDKPALDDSLLMHYDVKGMKWGVRKKDPDFRKSDDLPTKRENKEAFE